MAKKHFTGSIDDQVEHAAKNGLYWLAECRRLTDGATGPWEDIPGWEHADRQQELWRKQHSRLVRERMNPTVVTVPVAKEQHDHSFQRFMQATISAVIPGLSEGGAA